MPLVLAAQACGGKEPTARPSPTPTAVPTLPPTPTPAASAAAEVPSVSVAEVKSKLDSGQNMVLLDVREPADYSASHIGGAISIPVDALPGRYKDIAQGPEVIVYADCG